VNNRFTVIGGSAPAKRSRRGGNPIDLDGAADMRYSGSSYYDENGEEEFI
jgi:hypothetical protein